MLLPLHGQADTLCQHRQHRSSRLLPCHTLAEVNALCSDSSVRAITKCCLIGPRNASLTCRTTPHTHKTAHELFFVLAGSGEAFCDGERFPLSAGDAVVFPPTTVHGIDNGAAGRMYCLELMLPNEMFAEFVRQGTDAGSLDARDLCVMLAQGCK